MGRGAVPPFLSAVAEVCIVRGDSLFTPSRSDHSARLRHIVCLQSRRLRPTCCSPHCRAEPSAQSLSTERKAWGSLSLKMRMRRFHKDTLYFYIWRIGTHMKNVFTVSSAKEQTSHTCSSEHDSDVRGCMVRTQKLHCTIPFRWHSGKGRTRDEGRWMGICQGPYPACGGAYTLLSRVANL